jgi:hypothetical protein
VGKDNNTQGFRDNFYNIQASFLVAGLELTNLIDNGVKLTDDNNFNNNEIQNAILQNVSFSAPGSVSINTSTSYTNLDYSFSHYYNVNIAFTGTNTYHAFAITNWPSSGNYGSMILQVTPNSANTTTFNIIGGNLLGPNDFPRQYQQVKPVFYEIWSRDNGSTIYVLELTSY